MLNELTKDDFFILINHKRNEFPNHRKTLYGVLAGNFIVTFPMTLIVFLASWYNTLPFYYTCTMIFALVIQFILFIVWKISKNRVLFFYLLAITTFSFPLYMGGLSLILIYWMEFSNISQIFFLIIIWGTLLLYFHSFSLIKKRLIQGVYRENGAGLLERSAIEEKIEIFSSIFSVIALPLTFALGKFRRIINRRSIIPSEIKNLMATIAFILLSLMVAFATPYRYHYFIINIYIEKRFKE